MDRAGSASAAPRAPLSSAQAASLFGHYAERPGPGTGADGEDPGAAALNARIRRGVAELRAALAEHSLDDGVRVLSRHPEEVRALQAAYDAAHSFTGRGLLADAEQALGSRHAAVFSALLARAGATTAQPGVRYFRPSTTGVGTDSQASQHRIVASPAVQVAVPGARICYSVSSGPQLHAEGSYTSYQWLCLNDPQTSPVHGAPTVIWGPSVARWDAVWGFPGNHRMLCRTVYHAREPDGRVTAHAPEYIEYQQTVQAEQDVLAHALASAPQRPDPEQQLRRLQAYRQALYAAEQQPHSAELAPQTRDALELQIRKLRERLRSTEGHTRHPVKAAHVASESARVSPLNVFVSRIAADGGGETWVLVDLTNPTDRRLTGEYTGHGSDAQHAIQSAVAAWDRGNRYPKGRLRVQIPAQTGVSGSPLDQEFQTDGASLWDSIAEFFSQVGFWAGIGTLGAAVAATLAPDPTVSKAAAVLLWTSILAGTTGTSIHLLQRHAEGMTTASEDALDALTLASNVLGGRWVLGATVKGMGLAGSRMGTAVVLGRIGTDTAQGVLLAAESVKEYQQILAEPDPKQRTDRLVRFFGQVALGGGLLILSMHGSRADLQRLGSQRASLARLGQPGQSVSLEAAARPAPDTAHEPALAPTKPELPGDSHAVPAAPTIEPSGAAPEKAAQPRPHSPPRIVDPVPGLFDSIDATPHKAPPGWRFLDEILTSPSTGVVKVCTYVTGPHGEEGRMVRMYVPEKKMLVMDAAFLDELPRWIDAGVPLRADKGTPTVAYLTLRQLKLAQVHFGELRTVKMSNIQNFETLLQLKQLTSQGLSLDEAIRQTHSVQYAMTSIQQSGHTVLGVRAHVDDSTHAFREQVGAIMNYFETRYDPARNAARVKKHDALLAQYGMQRSDVVLAGFDIYFDLAPHPKNLK
jgi:hypothetical protein